jgi:hypothetical protein
VVVFDPLSDDLRCKSEQNGLAEARECVSPQWWPYPSFRVPFLSNNIRVCQGVASSSCALPHSFELR